MDDIIDDIIRLARRCKRTAQVHNSEAWNSARKALVEAITDLHDAWSGSFIGYHAGIYTADLRPKRPGQHFDSEWGGQDAFSSRTTGEWAEFTYETIRDELLARANNPDLKLFEAEAADAKTAFRECRAELLPTIDAVLAQSKDGALREIQKEIRELKPFYSAQDLASIRIPKGQFFTRDSLAMTGGIQIPAHLKFEAWLGEQMSCFHQVETLGELAQRAATYLQKRHKMTGRTVAKKDGPIFIGHGRSHIWKELRDFLKDKLRLNYEEFNREPVAGKSTKERLLEMLDKCSFAFLLMTAEDEHADGSQHARENVIHEIGLFQGRLSFERAIVLLEEGCQEFSNIMGVGQIRFPKGSIMAKSEEIRDVLHREGLL